MQEQIPSPLSPATSIITEILPEALPHTPPQIGRWHPNLCLCPCAHGAHVLGDPAIYHDRFMSTQALMFMYLQ